jgi:hypothetical protein
LQKESKSLSLCAAGELDLVRCGAAWVATYLRQVRASEPLGQLVLETSEPGISIDWQLRPVERVAAPDGAAQGSVRQACTPSSPHRPGPSCPLRPNQNRRRHASPALVPADVCRGSWQAGSPQLAPDTAPTRRWSAKC